MRTDQASASARPASRTASWARSRAPRAWIIAPIIRPLQITSPHFSRRIPQVACEACRSREPHTSVKRDRA